MTSLNPETTSPPTSETTSDPALDSRPEFSDENLIENFQDHERLAESLPGFDFQEGSVGVEPETRLLNMRCPNCRKLYSVSDRHFRAGAKTLRFICVACSTAFAATERVAPELEAGSILVHLESTIMETPRPFISDPRVERLPAEPVPLRARSTERDCPKCGTKASLDQTECRSCGLVFAKYRSAAMTEGMPAEIRLEGRKDLADLWENVITSYDNDLAHERFVSACFAAESLAYASHKYARILAVTPFDETAKRMRGRIVGLASQNFETGRSGQWRFRVPGLNGLAICLATIVTIFGLIVPRSSNLAGIGAAMLVLSLSVRFFLRPPI